MSGQEADASKKFQHKEIPPKYICDSENEIVPFLVNKQNTLFPQDNLSVILFGSNIIFFKAAELFG